VFAATQADADSNNRKSLREKNISEDKRKFGHLTKVGYVLGSTF